MFRQNIVVDKLSATAALLCLSVNNSTQQTRAQTQCCFNVGPPLNQHKTYAIQLFSFFRQFTSVSDNRNQQLWDIYPMLVWCWASVKEGGPTSNQHWVDVNWCCWRGCCRQPFSLCQRHSWSTGSLSENSAKIFLVYAPRLICSKFHNHVRRYLF